MAVLLTRRRAVARLAAVALLAAVVALLVLSLALGRDPTLHLSAAPAPSQRVVDSIGVGTHLGYIETSYADFGLIRKRLEQLGVLHIRDEIYPHPSPRELREIAVLGESGIRADVIAGDPNAGPATSVLTVLRSIAPDLDAVEGPNEFDLHGGPDWVSQLRTYQRQLYDGVKADPRLSGLPVLAPSVVYGHWRKLGNLRNVADVGNGHPYASGGEPEPALKAQLPEYRINVGDRPVWVTETGYQTNTDPIIGEPGVPEAVQGGLILRSLLEDFKLGVQRTYLYELADERPDPGHQHTQFGLLRDDLSPKPAFYAVRNLIALLRDPGASFTPVPYPTKITGDTSGVETIELAKRDGTILIALWRRVDVWNPVTQQVLDVGQSTVNIRLPRPVRVARTFVPSRSARPAATEHNIRSLAVHLGSDPAILELTPTG